MILETALSMDLQKNLQQLKESYCQMMKLQAKGIQHFSPTSYNRILYTLAEAINETNYILNNNSYQGYMEVRAGEELKSQ